MSLEFETDDLFDKCLDARDDVEDGSDEDKGNNKTVDVSSIVKRKVRKPRLRFNVERLIGDRGIVVLEKRFQEAKAKFKGKGYEREDLELTMKILEHWTHRLYPQLPFDNILDRIEKLGAKRPVQNLMKRIRLGEESDLLNTDDNAQKSPSDSEEVDDVRTYDAMLSSPSHPPPNCFDNDDMGTPLPSKVPSPAVQPAQPSVQLTEEQRNTIRANRLRAIERRSKQHSLPIECTGEIDSKSASDSRCQVGSPTCEAHDNGI